MTKHFGRFLRESRLKAEIGLRKFAIMIDMKPSNLCNLEYGRISPPGNAEILSKIADAIGFKEGSDEETTLYDLAAKGRKGSLPTDVEQYAATHDGIPVLLRTLRDKKLNAQDLKDLTEFVKSHYKQDTVESSKDS